MWSHIDLVMGHNKISEAAFLYNMEPDLPLLWTTKCFYLYMQYEISWISLFKIEYNAAYQPPLLDPVEARTSCIGYKLLFMQYAIIV